MVLENTLFLFESPERIHHLKTMTVLAPVHRRLDLTAMIHLLWRVRGTPWNLAARLVRRHVDYLDTRRWGAAYFQDIVNEQCYNRRIVMKVGPIAYWDTSELENMSDMFSMIYSFNEPLTYWDTSKVYDMSFMFAYAETFDQPLERWNVSSVTNMCSMFYEAKMFNQPLASWDVSKVLFMDSMFENCPQFNQHLERWDVANVLEMQRMFHNAIRFNRPPRQVERRRRPGFVSRPNVGRNVV